MSIEDRLRTYLARDLGRVERGLVLLEEEHLFPGGRIDILARQGDARVALELKAQPYSTQQVCAQLMNYLHYVPRVYFIAPKVRYGVYATMQDHYRQDRLKLFEIDSHLDIRRVVPHDLDDTRPFPRLAVSAQPKRATGSPLALEIAKHVSSYVRKPLHKKLFLLAAEHIFGPQRS